MADKRRSQKRSDYTDGSRRAGGTRGKSEQGRARAGAGRPDAPGRQGRPSGRANSDGPRSSDRGGRFRQRGTEERAGTRAHAHCADVSTRASRGDRPVTGTFIEGRRAAAEALRTGFPIKRALIAQGVEDEPTIRGIADNLAAAGVRIKRVPRTLLDELSSHGAHQGIALEVGAFPYAELADIVAAAPADTPALVLVLDHVTDAGNFGAIVRSAEVVGATGVVIPAKRAAEVTVATYKTSAGAVMHLPIARVPNIARALDDLKAAGFWACGASEHADGVCWDAPFEGRVALVMGSEGDGISRLVLEKCDFLTKLPQLGATESLNVAQAATALSFEWLRRNIDALPDGAAKAGA